MIANNSALKTIWPMDSINPECVKRQIVLEKQSHHDVSDILKTRFHLNRGVSERSVGRFYEKHDIQYRSGMDSESLVTAARDAVRKVKYVYFSYF